MINFEEVKNQNITKELLLILIEKLYRVIKNSTPQNIIFNEFVDNMRPDLDSNDFVITLSKKPISLNDIIVVSEDGSFIITPSEFTNLKGNLLYFNSKKVPSKINFFVSYKY